MFIEKRLLIVNVVLLFVLLSFMLLGCNASSVVVSKTVKSDVIKSDILLAVSDNTGASAASVGDSKTIIFSAYPAEACQSCTWSLTIDETKMNSWLIGKVKDKLSSGVVFINLIIDGNKCTVTANEYFNFGIKYTTYWTLTATSTENTEFSASCSIQLG